MASHWLNIQSVVVPYTDCAPSSIFAKATADKTTLHLGWIMSKFVGEGGDLVPAYAEIPEP